MIQYINKSTRAGGRYWWDYFYIFLRVTQKREPIVSYWVYFFSSYAIRVAIFRTFIFGIKSVNIECDGNIVCQINAEMNKAAVEMDFDTTLTVEDTI